MDQLHFEESVVDGFVGDFSKIERPISNNIFIFSAIFSATIFLIVFTRVFLLGIFWGDFYEQRAIVNTQKQIILPSQRGLISDRFNKPLLRNVPSFSVSIDVGSVLRLKNLNLITQKLNEVLGADAAEIIKRFRQVNLENTDRVMIAKDITLEQAINLKTLNLEGVDINDDYKRDYIDSNIFSHVLGYTGIGDQGNEVIGISGLESFYDSSLRGQNGEYFILRDVKGNSIDKKVLKEAVPGSQLITTIDAEFQTYFYNRLQVGLEKLGRTSGIGIAMNPQNGEILALINFPGFDNNQPAKYLNIITKPLFNRAVSGLYNPGSTIKPLLALAALKEKLITPEWQTYSSGVLEIPNPYVPDKPSKFLDWKAHGWVNLYSALARSSNIYFYALGGGIKGELKGLGINKLNEYWQKFGFNESTGIDLDSEAVGFLPNPDEKEKRTGQIWRLGDTYNVSIGQGDLSITPLRLLTFISSIASSGKTYRPFLVQRVVDEKNNVIQENKPEIIFDYSDWWAEIKEVQRGMRDTVAQPYGTANMLYDLPYKTSGKTGSAQIQNNTKTNAFFVGYGPSDPPAGGAKIAILVLVEDAKEGSINTLLIAYDVLKWYYNNRL